MNVYRMNAEHFRGLLDYMKDFVENPSKDLSKQEELQNKVNELMGCLQPRPTYEWRKKIYILCNRAIAKVQGNDNLVSTIGKILSIVGTQISISLTADNCSRSEALCHYRQGFPNEDNTLGELPLQSYASFFEIPLESRQSCFFPSDEASLAFKSYIENGKIAITEDTWEDLVSFARGLQCKELLTILDEWAIKHIDLNQQDFPFFERIVAHHVSGIDLLPKTRDKIFNHALRKYQDDFLRHLENSPWLHFLLSYRGGIRSFDLSGDLASTVTDTFLQAIIPFSTRIHHLNLKKCEKITDEGVAHLAQLTDLQSLSLAGCNKITDKGLINLAEQLTGLQSLDLAWCRRITDAGLVHLALRLTGLQSLNLDHLLRITDTGLIILARFTGLHSLSLAFCGNMTDERLAHLALHLKGLRSLSLEACEKITDAGLAHLALHLTGLQSLNLEHVKITGVGLTHLAQLKGLQSLSLAWCWNITDEILAHLVTSFTGLQSLDLSECRYITDKGLAHLALHLPGLQSLNLNYCTMISKAGLAHLVHLRKLQSLKLYGITIKATEFIQLKAELLDRIPDVVVER